VAVAGLGDQFPAPEVGGFHGEPLLALPERCLGTPALGDVATDGLPETIRGERVAELERNVRAVRATDLPDISDLMARGEFAHQIAQSRGLLLTDDVADTQPEVLLAGIAEHRARRRVHVDEPALPIGEPYPVCGSLEKQPVVLLALAFWQPTGHQGISRVTSGVRAAVLTASTSSSIPALLAT